MRIWHSYGSEHSMDLVLVGTFETVSGAEAPPLERGRYSAD